MACCLIAAFLLAQCMAALRRWGMFWGFVTIPEGEVVDTAYSRLLMWVKRAPVRRAIAAMLVMELLAIGSWTYVRHGKHIVQLADIGWSRMHGQHVVYADMCGLKGETSVRLVLDDSRHPNTDKI